MSFAIRRLSASDIGAYRAIRLEALTRHPEAYGTSAEAFAGRSDAMVASMLETLAVFGAFDAAGQLMGIMAFGRDEGERETHRGWLMQVYVRPEARGSGCAAALIETVIAHARHAVIQLHLMVGTHNVPAIRLYQRAGFKTYGTDPRCLYVNGQYIDEHMMVRLLDQPVTQGPTESDNND